MDTPLPPGNYRIQGDITIQGDNTTCFTTTKQATTKIICDEASFIGTGTGQTAIESLGNQDRISNCVFEQVSSPIVVRGVASLIEHNTIRSAEYGVYVALGSERASIKHNSISNTTQSGILVNQSAFARIEKNRHKVQK